jgi:1,4-dihydroxy-2-naphthoyl-CoA hydrolase
MSDEPWYKGLARAGMASAIGIEILELTCERVTATMPVDDRTRQPFGILHGGASMALAETVASLGATACIDRAQFIAVGQEINGNHVRSKSDGIVTAVATPLHVGRRSHVWSIRITDEQENLICVARCTMAIVPRSGSSP